MPTHDASLKMIAALIQAESRTTLFSLAAVLVGAGSCVETTFELTNRICDRYFPAAARPKSKSSAAAFAASKNPAR